MEVTGDINLDDDGHLDEPGITSTINPDTVLDKETPEDEEPKEPSKPKTDWESDDNPYKKRFGDSTREVNENLLPKIKVAEGVTAQERARAEKIQAERDEALARLKEEKPETYDNLTMQKKLNETSLKLAEIEEKQNLDDFVSDEPLAKPFRDALKAHARAFPTKSLTDIWNESFKDVAEIRKTQAEETKLAKKESQPDKGKGTSTKEPGARMIGDYTEEEFNKLPVMKRREILDKLNITL